MTPSLRKQGPIGRDISLRDAERRSPDRQIVLTNQRRWLWVPAFAGTTENGLPFDIRI